MSVRVEASKKEIHPDLLELVESAYLRIDAALPTIIGTLERLGNTDEARTYAMVQWAIEDAHRDLGKIYRGEV